MKILLAGADRAIADAFSDLARSLDHEVYVARDLPGATTLVQEHRFDVVFVDNGLLAGKQLELCIFIRESGRSREACVIAVTENTDLRRRDPDPFDGYIRKPVTDALERVRSFKRAASRA
jgi:CheY-like chemotaxis protein